MSGHAVIVEDLPKLAPRQRQVMELRLQGFGQATIADILGIKRRDVPRIESKARARLADDRPRRVKSANGAETCGRGHPREQGKKCSACVAEYEASRARTVTPEQEASAVSHEKRLTALGRCQHQMRRGPCGLLLPCWDHDTDPPLRPMTELPANINDRA